MHTINTFLFGSAGDSSREKIYDHVRQYFEGEDGVEISEDWLPFDMAASLRVTFDKTYFFTVDYIDDEDIHESLLYIEKSTSIKLPHERLLCEVRTNFGNDKNSDFDHITVSMYEFLEALPNSVVYDDNHKTIVSNRA